MHSEQPSSEDHNASAQAPNVPTPDSAHNNKIMLAVLAVIVGALALLFVWSSQVAI